MDGAKLRPQRSSVSGRSMIRRMFRRSAGSYSISTCGVAVSKKTPYNHLERYWKALKASKGAAMRCDVLVSRP